MVSVEELLAYYPPKLYNYQKWILREYLQYLILQTIFSNSYANKLCFIWWTSLRIWYNSQRFSEDLDFDNWWLSEAEFEDISKQVESMLIWEWFQVNISLIYKWAFHCIIKIPQLLYENNLWSMPTENLTIKIDTVSQWFEYESDKKIIQNFWLVFPLNIASESTLLSMKLNAFFSRVKWRDIFDIVYLIWRVKSPNRDILKQAQNISSPDELHERILSRLNELDLNRLQQDVKPFLFDPNNQSVILFPEIIKNTKFEF